MIGIKGYDVPNATLPPANLVLLLDPSGTMNSPDKLPLLRQSMKQLVNKLRPQDHVSIEDYAGSAGLVRPPTLGARDRECVWWRKWVAVRFSCCSLRNLKKKKK